MKGAASGWVLVIAMAIAPRATAQLGAPAAFTQTAGPVLSTNATLNGMVWPKGNPTFAWFEWGPDTSYGNTTAPVTATGASVVRVSSGIQDLVMGGVYHCRLVASNSVGVVRGFDQPFTTGMRVQNWGGYPYGRPVIPTGLTNLVGVAAGHGHCLVLRNDGTLAAWMVGFSYPDHGQTNVPAGLSNVVAIAGGFSDSLAVKADGTVVAWGAYMDGKAVTVPASLTNVVAVAAGDYHCVALKADGTVAAWGENSSGQTNVPAGLRNVVAIACGSSHTLALKADGTVASWGSDIGSGPPPASATNVVAIASDVWYNLALRHDGTVIDWGNYNQDVPKPTPLTNVAAVATGFGYGEVLKADGTLAAWGKTIDATNIPPGLSNVVAFASGDDHCVGLAAVDLPPACFPGSRTGGTNQDLALVLPVYDPNGDELAVQITSLPARGTLFQYTDGGRGDPILAPDTVLTTPPRVIFAPDPGTFGVNYCSIGFSAFDGEYLSNPASYSLSIVPPPVIQSVEFGGSSTNTLALNFTGLAGANYAVLRSSAFGTWTYLGKATETTSGEFSFTDYTITNSPVGFYRVWAY